MGLLNPRPQVEPGENILWQSRANYVEGPYYSLYGFKSAAGGQLDPGPVRPVTRAWTEAASGIGSA